MARHEAVKRASVEGDCQPDACDLRLLHVKAPNSSVLGTVRHAARWMYSHLAAQLAEQWTWDEAYSSHRSQGRTEADYDHQVVSRPR